VTFRAHACVLHFLRMRRCWRGTLLALVLMAGCAVPTFAITESTDNLVVFGPGETAAFDRDVMGGNLVWVVAVVDHSSASSPHAIGMRLPLTPVGVVCSSSATLTG
jgi:hypothetical protein